jgi:hypothetical protein
MSGWVLANNRVVSYALEILPTAGTDTGTTVLNVEQSVGGYRAWQMSSLYNPPEN